MKQVKAMKASDGKLFDVSTAAGLKEAKAYEAKLKRTKAIKELVEAGCYNGMDRDDVADFIADNIEEIIRIAKGA